MSSKHDLSDFVLDKYNLHISARYNKIDEDMVIYVNDDFKHKVMCNISKEIEDCVEPIFIEIAVKK